MPPERVERRLAAILAADVAGYSRLMGADEEGTLSRLKANRRDLIDPKISEYRGRIVKTTGDGILIEFPSVVDAVGCAIDVQRAMADRNASEAAGQRIQFRVGVNLGDIIIDGDDIHGDGVNIAARLEGLAEPGGICISQTVLNHTRGKITVDVEDLGEQALKNIVQLIHVFRIVLSSGHGSAMSRSPEPVPVLPDKPSLAVLPFQNMTGDPEQDYFVDGMVEEITTAISRLPWLFVIARNSSFTYKNKSVDIKQVARELGVRYVLEGSVRKAGNRVRITGQLVDAPSGAHIWADRFDGTLDDVFELQDQMASSVVGAIQPKLRQSEIERVARKPVESLDAYDFYLQALAQLRNNYTEEGLREAVVLLQRALSIAPDYALAAAMIGRCRSGQRVQGFGPLSDAEVAEAVRLARHAIDTGKSDPDALLQAAWTLSSFAGEHTTAASTVDRALALNPNSAEAWTTRGWIACYQNNPRGAIDAFERAMRLSPLDPTGYHNAAGRALAYLIAGEYERAAEWADRSLSEFACYGPAIRTKVTACVQLGRIAEARALLGRMNEQQPGLTVSKFKAYMAKNFPPEVLVTYADGLRKAGLPEG
jgi:adenylate cyclase